MKKIRFILIFIRLANPVYALEENKLTDLAALQTQEISIQKLQKLLSQYRNTPREAELLSRLADYDLQRSGITFRVSEGIKEEKGINHRPLYLQSLKESVQVYSELIEKFPDFDQSTFARYKRGKALKELNQIKEATNDYQYLTLHHPEFEYIDSVYFDLAEFAADANQHEEALRYLSEIEKNKKSEYYPLALQKTAWSQFNLGHHEKALAYLKIESDFYHATQDMNSADLAFMENIDHDASLFYFEALNKKASFASIKHAIGYFRQLDGESHWGGLALRLAKLLKAYELYPELNQLKNELLVKEIKNPETAEIVLLIFKSQFEKRNFSELEPLMNDLKKLKKGLHQKELDAKIEEILSQSLLELHHLVLKNKLVNEKMTLLNPLMLLTRLASELYKEDPTHALLAQFSLAETLFELKEFSKATKIYEELRNSKFNPVLSAIHITPLDLSLRLISSRYQELKQLKGVPEPFTIQSLQDPILNLSPDEMAKIKEWVQWIDQTASPRLTAFELEAGKIIYTHVNRKEGIKRLEAFAFAHAQTEEGMTALKLVMNTNVQSQDWKAVSSLCEKIIPHPSLKTEPTLSFFQKSFVTPECSLMNARLELETGEFESAEHDLSSLLESKSHGFTSETLLLLRAEARTKAGKLKDANQDLYRYQILTHFQDSQITQNILAYAWLKKNQTDLDALLNHPEACKGKNTVICEPYFALQVLNDSQKQKINYEALFKKTIHSPKSLIAVWALASLKNPKRVPLQDRMILLQRLSQAWEDLNPLLQIHLLEITRSRVNETLDSIRAIAPAIAPISENPASIAKRITLLKEIDMTLAKTMQLPWFSIKLRCVTELTLHYDRFIEDLKKIRTPETLLKPFLTKKNELEGVLVSLKQNEKKWNAPLASPSADVMLLSQEIKTALPACLWEEWKSGVHEKRPDYLFYLLSMGEASHPDLKEKTPLIRGLVLLLGNAPSEAYALIQSAPSSPFQSEILARFETTGTQSP